MSAARSSTNTRTSSMTRPMPLLNTTSSVSSITRAMQSGSMNVTINTSGSRPIIGGRLGSTDRTNTSTRNIPATTSLNQRRVSNDTIRSRLSSQDRSAVTTNQHYTNGAVNESSNDYPERHDTNGFNLTSTTNTNEESTNAKASSIDRQDSHSPSPLESKLKQGGLTGLQNLGNTCFMNSVLQCLSNTKPLLLFCFKENLSEYLNTSSTSVMKGVLMREYANLIRKMWTSSDGHSIVSPSSFKNTIGRFAPRFLGYAQQDSQEFLRYLLQGLHEDVNLVQRKPSPIKIDEKAEEKMKERDRAKLGWERCLLYDNSAISDIFAGQLKSTLECCHCQYQSTTFDMFWDLSIPLPRNKSSSSVQECIQLFMSKEDLDGNEKPMCARCKQKRRCTKKFSIQKCPDILVLHLKRFSQARGRTKLSTDVDFPINNLKLADLTDVMSESYEGPVPTYNLFGISNHSGTAYSGHYVAQCKHPFTNQWHEFNDSSVYSMGDKSRIISSNAYVLFYERNK
ncbi:unnamed protein product [Rotaria sp. Silwood2]|nr:unnamed protein product [Rotaria sp. Silwood2]CAF2824610.1 unnamed protein product [Rotaria sp. Silwood2]CAF3089967.1 unnamed protein product [Rotaria sp. Silwood2]CAF3228917.1 unnamed protein product [Rotaria sp. Silwood2]CAF4003191.1 unnamed protein product [Rotaria sp. Silwood2]